MLTGRLREGTGLHRVHGVIILCLTALFYFVFIGQYDSYNRMNGGGQPTLPGFDKIVAFILFLVVVVISVCQLLLFRIVRRASRVSWANVAIALPIIIAIPFSLRLVDLPEKYCWFTFGGLLLSQLLHYCSLRFRYAALLLFSYLLAAISLFASMYWAARSEQHPKWWDNGRSIEYYENGNKKWEAENKKEGIIFGNFTQWNIDGTLAAFDRYPKGHLSASDSSVRYFPDGLPMKKDYTFDSADARYERHLGYSYTGLISSFKTINTKTLQTTDADYDRETGQLRYYEYTFDSAGVRYKRQLQYDDHGVKRAILQNLRTNSRYDKKFR